MVNYWLLQNSFTIGVADTVADKETLDEIAKAIETTKTKVSYCLSARMSQY